MSESQRTVRPRLRVVFGAEAEAVTADRGTASHVCTWCALRFDRRSQLDAHRAASAACRANQRVSSPLQTRYGDAEMVWTQPGEATLHRVRSRTCAHRQPRARLVDGAGATIGYQCGWCYGLLPEDLPGR